MINLLQNSGIATGASVLIARAGHYAWRTEGTFGGTTVTLEYLTNDGVMWSGLDGLSATALGEQVVLIEEDTYVRAKVTGGTTPNITSNLRFIA